MYCYCNCSLIPAPIKSTLIVFLHWWGVNNVSLFTKNSSGKLGIGWFRAENSGLTGEQCSKKDLNLGENLQTVQSNLFCRLRPFKKWLRTFFLNFKLPLPIENHKFSLKIFVLSSGFKESNVLFQRCDNLQQSLVCVCNAKCTPDGLWVEQCLTRPCIDRN